MLRRPNMRVRVRVQPMHFSFNRMIPNVLTVLALCAGMTAIRLAIVGKFETAVAAIIVAGILDGLDGRIARLLKGTSTFGAQLDSLSDFVSFGVAPAVMLYVWTMDQFHGFGWAIVLIFAVCCALRLARFNTQLGQELPPYAYNFFTGVPAPAGAGLAMVPMFAAFEFGDTFFRAPTLNTIWILAVAVDGEPGPDLRAEALPCAERMGAPDAPGRGRDGGLPHHRALGDAADRRRRLYRLLPLQHPLLPQAQAHRRGDARRNHAGRERSRCRRAAGEVIAMTSVLLRPPSPPSPSRGEGVLCTAHRFNLPLPP